MATKKITQLPVVTGVTGANVVPLVAGTTTSQVSLSTLLTFFGGTGPTGPAGAGSTGPTGVGGPTGPTGVGEFYQTDVAPAVAAAGSMWLDTATGKYFTRYSGLWVEVGGKHYP